MVEAFEVASRDLFVSAKSLERTQGCMAHNRAP
jgi:hypothetical protein